MTIEGGIASEYTAGNAWIKQVAVGSEAYKIETIGNTYEVTPGKVKNFICKSEFASQDEYFEAIDKMIDTADGSTWEFITDKDCYYVEIELEDESRIEADVSYNNTEIC